MKYDKSAMTFVKKGWGSELHLVNNDLYCGKILSIEKDKKLSVHYHLLKDETFYCTKGKVIIYWSDEKDEEALEEALKSGNRSSLKEEILSPGDAFHIPAGRIHQPWALEDSELIEFSTTHYDDDSYRLQKGD
jgi:quercetin dioxygenase-like cupin family protein